MGCLGEEQKVGGVQMILRGTSVGKWRGKRIKNGWGVSMLSRCVCVSGCVSKAMGVRPWV